MRSKFCKGKFVLIFYIVFCGQYFNNCNKQKYLQSGDPEILHFRNSADSVYPVSCTYLYIKKTFKNCNVSEIFGSVKGSENILVFFRKISFHVIKGYQKMDYVILNKKCCYYLLTKCLPFTKKSHFWKQHQTPHIFNFNVTYFKKKCSPFTKVFFIIFWNKIYFRKNCSKYLKKIHCPKWS